MSFRDDRLSNRWNFKWDYIGGRTTSPLLEEASSETKAAFAPLSLPPPDASSSEKPYSRESKAVNRRKFWSCLFRFICSYSPGAMASSRDLALVLTVASRSPPAFYVKQSQKLPMFIFQACSERTTNMCRGLRP